jgi:phosphotransferase family enzyme
MHVSSEHPSGLDEDLEQALADLGATPARIEVVSSPHSPRPRPGAFRLCLADGRQLKATLTTSGGHAKKVKYLLGCLDARVFPPVLARHGRVIVTEWINGEPLEVDASPARLREAAAVQAKLHLTPVPADCRYPTRDLDGLAVQAEADMRAAADLDAIGDVRAGAAVDALRRFAPSVADCGFVHRDFCPENLVVGGGGALCAIDNETISLGPYDFDLARTWYRWPMDAARRRIHLEAYAARRATGAFLDHFPFWAIAVLADSIQLRRAAAGPVLSAPVERLRALLDALAANADARELVFAT